jgi:tryptophanyl-tRNA synthetase
MGMQPIHERQDYFRGHIDEVKSIIEDGITRAIRIARATMDEVREAVKI